MVGDQEFKEPERRSEKSDTFEVEVVEKIPPPHFNSPLTCPNDPILFQVRELFKDPFHCLVILISCRAQVSSLVWLSIQSHRRV